MTTYSIIPFYSYFLKFSKKMIKIFETFLKNGKRDTLLPKFSKNNSVTYRAPPLQNCPFWIFVPYRRCSL